MWSFFVLVAVYRFKILLRKFSVQCMLGDSGDYTVDTWSEYLQSNADFHSATQSGDLLLCNAEHYAAGD